MEQWFVSPAGISGLCKVSWNFHESKNHASKATDEILPSKSSSPFYPLECIQALVRTNGVQQAPDASFSQRPSYTDPFTDQAPPPAAATPADTDPALAEAIPP